MIALLLFQVALLGVKPVPDPLPMSGESRTFHPVMIEKLHLTRWTHVCVVGVITLRTREADGDWHLRLQNGNRYFVVAEIVPELPQADPPQTGTRVEVCGISRLDPGHNVAGLYPRGWPEVHPVLRPVRVVSQKGRAASSITGMAAAPVQRVMAAPAAWPWRPSLPQLEALTDLALAAKAHKWIDRHHQANRVDSTESNNEYRLPVRGEIRLPLADIHSKQSGEASRHVSVGRIESNTRVTSRVVVAIRERSLSFKQSSNPRELYRGHLERFL